MARKQLLIRAGAVTLAVIITIDIAAATHRTSPGPGPPPSHATIARELRGSPPALAALHAQADELLPGGGGALQARLAALRGHPVLVNKWASWCPPCRAEFPVFQQVSAAMGREIAFVGLDSNDPGGGGAAFLRKFPVSYPSYIDRGGSLGTAITLSTNFPVTAFYDARGRRTFIHQGSFTTVAQLETDIRRYALDS